MAGLLRFVTAGSVDDGKSTLMGRLLYDIGSIYEDQLAAIRRASPHTQNVDLALVTDGLRAEREQGITIDVAYRHFATARRRFLIADAPGHEQYTRNMATGASTAELAVLLMDARKGVLEQTRRHSSIAWLLGIHKLAVVVNKMDLVNFDEAVFRRCESDYLKFASSLPGLKTFFFPVCAVDGDNVVARSQRTPWFSGPSLLEFLETVPIKDGETQQLRLPVQNIIRSGEERYYTGQIASGTLRIRDCISVLPSGSLASIASIQIGDRSVESARAPLSVSVVLDREIDVSGGDMIVEPAHLPMVSRRFSAILLWMSDQGLKPGHPYLLKHTSKQVCASVTRLQAVIDPATLDKRAAQSLGANEFGEVEIETHQPLVFDPYQYNRSTGNFIVIDPLQNGTCAAGMIRANLELPGAVPKTVPEAGLTVWFTGLSSAGKSTISRAVYEKLWAAGHKVEWLDGDVIRQHLNKGLGFNKADRDENVRRIGFVAELLTRNGVIALVSAIAPYRGIRDELRLRIGNFIEVFVHAPIEICEQRDLKGIYRRARLGELTGVTGIDDPYEPPFAPEVECRTDTETPAESAANVLAAIRQWLAEHSK
jgi:bifunctional enzyme CysN/CysC